MTKDEDLKAAAAYFIDNASALLKVITDKIRNT